MRKFRLSKKKISLIAALIILFITFIQQLLVSKNQPTRTKSLITTFPSTTTSAQLVKVTRVVDGDTIELENKQKVRYIGIDTPELHDPRKPVQCFAYEAMLKNKELVEGKNVRLEKDVSETDKYRRLLRFIYVPTEASPSGLFVNDYLVRQGYAYAVTFPPDVKYADHFLLLEQEARENKRGLWLKCG